MGIVNVQDEYQCAPPIHDDGEDRGRIDAEVTSYTWLAWMLVDSANDHADTDSAGRIVDDMSCAGIEKR